MSIDNGVSTYSYDAANRLTGATQGQNSYSFGYDGLGNRYQQTANGMTTTDTLDLAGGLSQVLYDGTTSYYYGLIVSPNKKAAFRIISSPMDWAVYADGRIRAGRSRLVRFLTPLVI